MGAYQKFLNMDDYFKQTEGDKIILNDLNPGSLDDIENINRALMTVYDSDVISTIPSCDCGATKKRCRVGRTCHECGTLVLEPNQKVKPLMWLKRLNNTPKFLNPQIWLIINSMLAKNIDCVRWMCDTSYNPPVELPNYLPAIKNIMGERSYVNFINNLPNILIYLANHSKIKRTAKAKEFMYLVTLYETNKEILFSNYLPIINKKLFVMENTIKGKFTNLSVSEVVDLVLMWVKVANDDGLSAKRKNNAIANILSKFSGLYASYFDKYLNGKTKIFRKHVFGTRSHFTFRSVITLISKPHDYDTVEVPWSIGVTAFRPHILNKLIKRGYSYMDANRLLFKSVKCWDKTISEILDELIRESKYKGIPLLFQRNPSLLQGSAYLLYITKFKNDLTDNTISLSVLIVKSSNADFDGDAMNATILLDNKLAEEFMTFSPHYSIPDLSKPLSVSGNLSLFGASTSILNNYLYKKKHDMVNEDTISSRLKTITI